MVRNKSSLLIDEPPLMVLPSLAKAIGLNEAIFVQQLHWSLLNFGKTVNGQEGKWIYNTFEEWAEKFPFWSVSTIKRIVTGLRKEGVIKAGRFNKMAIDQTRWYSIDYDELNKRSPIVSTWHNGLGQSDTMTLGQSDPMLPKIQKNTDQREDVGEPLPEPTRPAELPPAAPHHDIHPFVKAHKEIVGTVLNRMQRAELEDMPLDADSVAWWRENLRTWMLNGWSTRSLPGMIDRYRKGPEAANAKPHRADTPRQPQTRMNGTVKEEKVGGVWYPVAASQGAR